MTCIIVDDDLMSRKALETLCEKIDDLSVVGVFETGIESINFLKNNEVDLIFLDIEMPDLSGIDIVKSVVDLPQIIFTSGHTSYAIEAFEYHVTDFLPKPVQLPRLLKAIERARQLTGNIREQDKDNLFIRVDGKFVRLNLNTVQYIQSLGDYVTFVDDNNKKYIVHGTVKAIADKISHPHFLKIHRSFIINITKIVDIDDTNLVIKDKVFPVSRAHRQLLMSRIKTL